MGCQKAEWLWVAVDDEEGWSVDGDAVRLVVVVVEGSPVVVVVRRVDVSLRFSICDSI